MRNLKHLLLLVVFFSCSKAKTNTNKTFFIEISLEENWPNTILNDFKKDLNEIISSNDCFVYNNDQASEISCDKKTL